MTRLCLITLIAGSASLLAACGGGGGSTTVVSTPSAPSPQAKYGSQFATDFSASANASPAAVSSTDVVPPDPTATPSSVP